MLRFLTAGESHGPALTAIIEGMVAGVPVSEKEIRAELTRRRHGYGRGTRMKLEEDRLEGLAAAESPRGAAASWAAAGGPRLGTRAE